MAPYFLRNLLPRPETRKEGKPLLDVLASLTWVQWAMFWSGYAHIFSFQPHHNILAEPFAL